jgi:ornithine carbamoyltransferase
MAQAAPGAFVMHDLPAHRGEEINEEAIESKNSIVFDQAENRVWAQAAVVTFLLGLADEVS